MALTNQLRAELERFWPGATKVFARLESQTALAFLERYPSPLDARVLGEQRLGAFLARQGYSGRKPARELLAKLRQAPEGRAGEQEIAMRRQLVVLGLVAALKPLVHQIKTLERQIAQTIREHPDGAIFLSLFRDPKSVVTAATMLAEIGDRRARYPTRDALAGDASQGERDDLTPAEGQAGDIEHRDGAVRLADAGEEEDLTGVHSAARYLRRH